MQKHDLLFLVVFVLRLAELTPFVLSAMEFHRKVPHGMERNKWADAFKALRFTSNMGFVLRLVRFPPCNV